MLFRSILTLQLPQKISRRSRLWQAESVRSKVCYRDKLCALCLHFRYDFNLSQHPFLGENEKLSQMLNELDESSKSKAAELSKEREEVTQLKAEIDKMKEDHKTQITQVTDSASSEISNGEKSGVCILLEKNIGPPTEAMFTW